jgi:dephospho-CoA kinase
MAQIYGTKKNLSIEPDWPCQGSIKIDIGVTRIKAWGFKMVSSQKEILKIAVTGSAGSGKSAVCARFKALGLPVLSSDELARQAVSPGMPAYEKIVGFFGKEILAETGLLDRRRMRERILQDPASKKALEGFVHPEIFFLMEKGIDNASKKGEKGVVVEVPLLFELGMEKMFDMIVLVSIDRDLQIRRLMARDQITADGAAALLALQMPEENKRTRAHVVIANNGSMEEMMRAVDQIYHDHIRKQFR